MELEVAYRPRAEVAQWENEEGNVRVPPCEEAGETGRRTSGAAKRYAALLLRKTTCIQLPRGFINSSVTLRDQNALFVATS